MSINDLENLVIAFTCEIERKRASRGRQTIGPWWSKNITSFSWLEVMKNKIVMTTMTTAIII